MTEQEKQTKLLEKIEANTRLILYSIALIFGFYLGFVL